MNILLKIFFLICFCFFIEKETLAQNKFSNEPELQKIYTLQNQHKAAALSAYFNNDNLTLRNAAFLAFASLKDSSYVPVLLSFLTKKQDFECKKAIIYSLGQTPCHQSFLGLMRYYETERNVPLSGYCIEAIGKVSFGQLNGFFVSTEIQIDHQEWMKNYWYGLYFAFKRKSIDMNDEAFVQHINQLIKQKSEEPYTTIFNLLNRVPEAVNKSKKTELHKFECQRHEHKMQSLKTPYQQLDYLKTFQLDEETLLYFIFSNNPSLIRAYTLDLYITKYQQLELYEKKLSAVFFQNLLKTKDVAIISRVCEYVLFHKNNAITIKKEQLEAVQKILVLPQDYETWVDLEKAIYQLNGKQYAYSSYFNTGYQPAINWQFIETIPQKQKIKITTNKGIIILECKVNDAPVSVSNFLYLVDTGYYNGKYFHRMVPNFVVQGGCPRGDGWGSLDWTQRSEFSNYLSYKPGSVGLASLGMDSEGVQFFITHTYTPNLDGRYTIFAEVIEGMKVVDLLKVGDLITKIERIYRVDKK